MALPVQFRQYQPWTWWVKIRNFYSSNSNYHRCKIFTSRYVFSKQAKTIELVRNRLQNSPVSNMATIFAKNVCDTLSNNMKLTLINAEINAALNLQEETVFFYPRCSPWLQCICSKMTSIKYLGALRVYNCRVITHESFGNVTPSHILKAVLLSAPIRWLPLCTPITNIFYR